LPEQEAAQKLLEAARILVLGGPFRKLSIRIKTRKFARIKLSTIEDSINAQFL